MNAKKCKLMRSAARAQSIGQSPKLFRYMYKAMKKNATALGNSVPYAVDRATRQAKLKS